mgnify:CR=1 FL=1|jgi:hypothetical protein
MTDYASYLQDLLRVAKQGHNVQMHLLKKTTSEKEEKKRKILNVEVDGEVLISFKENLAQKCNEMISDNELTYIDFFSEDPEDNVILVINQEDMKSVGTLNPIISQIKSEDDSRNVTEFNDNTIQNLQSYAISMSSIGNNGENKIEETCIYFRKYQVGSKIAKSKFFKVFEHKQGKFNKIEGDVFKYDDVIDAIYYERVDLDNPDQNGSKIMFVRNISNFEDMFSFEEFYTSNAKAAYTILQSCGNVEIEEALFKEITSDKRNLKKICKLNKGNFFTDIDFNRFFFIYNAASSLNYALNVESDGEKIKIKSKESFFEFIDICGNKLYGDLVDEKIYRGIAKELPKKSA